MPLYKHDATVQTSSSGVAYRVSDTDFVIPSDATIVQCYAQTATRTFTLPAGSTVTSGKRITVRDSSGSCWFGMPIIVQRSGSDTINGNQSRAYIEFPYSELTFTWDAATGWSYAESVPSRSDGWLINEPLGFSTNSINQVVQPAFSGAGLTWTALSNSAAGGLCLNGSLSTTSSNWGGVTAWAGTAPLQSGSGCGTFYLEMLCTIDQLLSATDGRFLLGFMTTGGLGANGEPGNGAYIKYEPAVSANWQGRNAANNSRSTVLDSGIAASISSFHRLAVKLAPGSVGFGLDRNYFGAISTNIPSGSGQKFSIGAYASRNNVNAGSQAFTFSLYGLRFFYVPPAPR